MSEVWTIDKCKAWLEKDIVSGKSDVQTFLNRLIDWHIKEYEKAGNPPKLEWADECLEKMRNCIKVMGLEPPPKRTLFSRLKED